MVVDRLESRNEFCVSCHLDPVTPLHRDISESFRARPALNLTGAHRIAEPDFRCIDCHGGTGLVGKFRVKIVSGWDTIKYLTGRFREPERMAAPLWDEDCVKCHAAYRPERADAFHAFPAHNVGLPYACVACHRAHPVGAPAELQFLEREVVLPICRDCHKEV
jgi:hypothetical protein